MREALIQFLQRQLKNRYNKTVVEIKDPFRDMQMLLASTSIHTVIDGGGYHGDVALQLAEMFPNATVYSFEPSATSFSILTANVKGNSRIIPVRNGLSSAKKRATLFVNAQDSTNSLSPVGEGGRTYQSWQTANVGSEEVNLVTLDAWAAENNVNDIDLLKLDLQGHELHALRGAEQTLKSKVKLIYTEVEFVRVYEENCLMFEMEGYLRSLDFELFQLYNITSGNDGQIVCGDAIFLSRQSVPHW